jgi:uncharacterized protein (TIGR00255 family)
MRSMTGFGQAAWEGEGVRLAVEVRGVNHRFLDVRLALPRDCQSWEPELRRLITDLVERGKVDVSVNRVGTPQGSRVVEIDEQLARSVIDGWRKLQKKLGLPGQIDIAFLQAMQSRGDFVRLVEQRGEAADELPRVRQLLEKALRAFDGARRREGAVLQRDMKARHANLVAIEKQLAARSREIVPQMAERLGARLGKLLDGREIEESRLLQEAAILAERSDVHEELVRLGSHLERLAGLLRQKGSVGKPIDFLLQEIHRELNTIASKSSDIEVTRLTLEGRAAVEKLREQIQNVE